MNRITHVNGIVDCHTHCGGYDMSNAMNLRYPCSQHVRGLLAEMDANDVDYAITFPMPSTFYYNTRAYWEKGIFIPSGLEETPYGVENTYLLNETVAFDISNVLPFVSFSVQDRIIEQCNNIIEWINRYPLYGLKLHTLADQTDLKRLLIKGEDFLNLARDYNLPIVVHSDNSVVSDPLGIFDIAEKYPTVRFSIAHFAGFKKKFFNLLKQYKRNYTNLFFDCSPCLHICDCYSKLTENNSIIDLDYSSPERVLSFFLGEFYDNILWGTDSPWLFAASLRTPIKSVITYADERMLLNNLKEQGKEFSLSAVNRFLFGEITEDNIYCLS